MTQGPSPRPPPWALAAGLPSPNPGETFCQYVERLGLDCAELLEGLNERTAVLANPRLASRIAHDMPEAYSRYLAARHRAAHGAI